MYTNTITLKSTELFQDISNYGYIQSNSVRREGGKVHLKDIVEFNNYEAVVRHIDLAFGKVVDLLYPYSKSSTRLDAESKDDTFTETVNYVVNLSFKWAFPNTTFDYLKDLVHNFIIYKVLFLYLDEAFSDEPNLAKVWSDKVDCIEKEIGKIIKRGKGITQRPAWPL